MATTFKDKKGREWDVALDLRKGYLIDKSDFTAIVEDYKFSILKPDRLLYGKLLTDAPFLFAVIWAMVQEQVAVKWQAYSDALTVWNSEHHSGTPFIAPPDVFPISPKEAEAAEAEFVSGVNGPTIESARIAFTEALADFFPEQRTVLSTLTRQVKNLSEKVGKKMEESEPLLNDLLDEELELGMKQLQDDLRNTREKRLGGISLASPAI